MTKVTNKWLFWISVVIVVFFNDAFMQFTSGFFSELLGFEYAGMNLMAGLLLFLILRLMSVEDKIKDD